MKIKSMNEAVVTLKLCHALTFLAVRWEAAVQQDSSPPPPPEAARHVCAHFLLPPRAVREREREGGRLLRAPPQRGWARPGRSGGVEEEEEEEEEWEDCPFVFRWFWNKRKKTADEAQPPPPPPPLLLLVDRLNARSGADSPQTPRTLPRTLPQTETAPRLRSDRANQQKVSAESKNDVLLNGVWWERRKKMQQSYFPLLHLSACFFVSCMIIFY